MAGRAKENLPGGSLKYLFVYFKIRIFKCSYRTGVWFMLQDFWIWLFFQMCSLYIRKLPLATPGRGYVGEVEGRGHENDDGWGMV